MCCYLRPCFEILYTTITSLPVQSTALLGISGAFYPVVVSQMSSLEDFAKATRPSS